MNPLTTYIHIIYTIAPFAMPLIVCYLYLLYKKESKKHTMKVEVYAQQCGVTVEEARKILWKLPY